VDIKTAAVDIDDNCVGVLKTEVFWGQGAAEILDPRGGNTQGGRLLSPTRTAESRHTCEQTHRDSIPYALTLTQTT